MHEIATEEFKVYDEISRLGKSLWSISLEITGSNRDPKMFSIMLYKRLWSNHRGYTILHNNGLSLEADIILRSGLEAAICLAANYRLGDRFVILMQRDVAFTLKGQIKIHRQAGAKDMVKQAEAELRKVSKSLPEGVKASRLDWKTLANHGQVPQLYGFHRMLSGISSHVTGMSVLKGIIDVNGDGAEAQERYRKISKRTHLMMMACATLQGSFIHAAMINNEQHIQTAKNLIDRMNEISAAWS